MAQGLDSGNSVLVTVGGWFVALVVALFTFVAQWRKGGVDETAVVLGKWKELVETHERQLSSLHQEIADLRGRVKALEEVIDDKDRIITQLRNDITGAERQLKQQGESFAEQLRRLGHNGPPSPGDEYDQKK